MQKLYTVSRIYGVTAGRRGHDPLQPRGQQHGSRIDHGCRTAFCRDMTGRNVHGDTLCSRYRARNIRRETANVFGNGFRVGKM